MYTLNEYTSDRIFLPDWLSELMPYTSTMNKGIHKQIDSTGIIVYVDANLAGNWDPHIAHLLRKIMKYIFSLFYSVKGSVTKLMYHIYAYIRSNN